MRKNVQTCRGISTNNILPPFLLKHENQKLLHKLAQYEKQLEEEPLLVEEPEDSS
ncbi:hypothetical protein L798_02323 [Zootermopsis nevadensis]|uniref:Uncharacterized protein n=1 Tax=Zootermopsis nevadensis TaxID=136037 RepID=A0A067QJY7_ZOONE|nr:hypothetical protein L798_02323 [Zootermopsis nevadensis]